MARSFNGSTDKIDCGTNALLVPTSLFVTYAGWVKPNTPIAYDGPFGSYGTGLGLGIFIKSDLKIAIYGGGGAVYDGTGSALSNGVWSHIAANFSNGDGSAFAGNGYINGVLDGHGSCGTLTTSQFLIGFSQSGGAPFHGSVAEVGVWNAILTAQEAAALAMGYSPLFIRPSSLVAYWPVIGRASPEIDRVGGFAGTVTGTTVDNHPRIIMPRGKKLQTKVVAVYVYMRPDADFSDGSWLNELGSNVDLYASVDETVASDTDYIQSSTTSGDKARLRLSDPGSGVAQPFAIRYRASATTGTASLFGRLYQGASTLIDSWNHAVDTTPTDYTRTLGSTEFALITDFNDLYIEFEYAP